MKRKSMSQKKNILKAVFTSAVVFAFVLPIGITTANNPDFDGDGWDDYQEMNIKYVDPYNPDTDDDGIPDPYDVDPLVDLSVTLKIKRVYASEYTYNWREGETWDRCSKAIFNVHQQQELQSADEVVNSILDDENISQSVKEVFSNISQNTIENQSAEEIVNFILDDENISQSVKDEVSSTLIGQDWMILSHSEASNGIYTRQATRNGVNDWAEWDFNVNKPGVYHIWIRNRRSDIGCSNVWPMWNGQDFFVKKWDDGGFAYDLCWYQPYDFGDLWRWTWYGAVFMDEGTGTLRLENRHEDLLHPRDGNPADYIEVDNILITDDPSCVPTGKGVEGRDTHEIGYAINYEFDAGSPPDFYIRTYVGSVERISPVWYDDDNVLDDWSTTVNVPDDHETVSLTIELWDEDGANDQLCDISPIGKTCNLIYNLSLATWTGDDSMDDIDFYGRTCGEVDGQWDYDADVIFEISQNDYDNDGITYWQEVSSDGPFKGSISPLVTNDRYAVIVGAGASCKLMHRGNIGSYTYPYRGTYLRYNDGFSWTDYTMFVDLMTNDDVEPDHEDIGVMFRYQDANNYYLLRWEQNGDNDRMLLWKFVNGVCTEIASPRYTDLAKNQWYTLKIVVSGNHIGILKNINSPMNGGAEAWTYVFNVQDSSLSHGGIALFTWKNRGAWFDDVLVKNSNGDILLSEDFDYGRIDKWTVIDEASGSSDWKLTDLSIDQEDFYIAPDYLYRVLRLGAHYKPSNIKYLSTDKYRDADGDGVNDVAGVSLKASVQYLLDDWLSSSSDANDLNLVYIFNHGSYSEEDGSFVAIDSDRDGYVWDSVLKPESLPVDPEYKLRDYEVDQWLPYYGSGGIGRLTFVVEACLIGHFIEVLSHPGESRIIVPSTTFNTSASGETGSDWPVFSYNLFKEMAGGKIDFMAAFNKAYDDVKNNFLSIQCGQDPKLDDNGDAVGHDHLPNGGDGNLALFTGL